VYALGLNGLAPLADLLGYILDLDHGVWLDDAQQILLEQGIIQRWRDASESLGRRELWSIYVMSSSQARKSPWGNKD